MKMNGLLIVLLAGLGACSGHKNEPKTQPPSTSPQLSSESATPQPAPLTDPNAPRGDTSYMPTVMTQPFGQVRARLSSTKGEIMLRQQHLLEKRYDLGDKPMPSMTMFRGKGIQGGVRVKLADHLTWQSLAAMSPAEIREKSLFPDGFKPLPHARTDEGGQVFPNMQIREILAQEGRDLNRFDVEFDIPEHFLPEFPPPMFLTSRSELGDVSRGVLVTNKNFFDIFNGILTPKQLDGLRLLVEPRPQQQFNRTDDRRSDHSHLGVACLDCHSNGHTNAAFHLDPQTRPQASRRRVDTPTLRGVNIQRLFGSQRALKSVEDFTEFEQRGAYFDGDFVLAAKKGIVFLDRGSEVANMAEFQSLLDFPPAPKLDLEGKLDPALATEAELRGQALFFGKAKCSSCHMPPYYTDNLMHDLKDQRFFKPEMINGRYATATGPIKTFPLRGIKETPPYLHDGRLLTLADTVEYFNLILELKLSESEKEDLVAFMMAL